MAETKYITKHIDRLLLDPNNYRFIDNLDYKPVGKKDIADARIQQRTYNFLVGKEEVNIQDLIKSFKYNGVLKLDPIQVRPVEDGNFFLVIEGNRRTAALKFLWEEFKKGNDVGVLKEWSFRSVDLINIEDESPVSHLVNMGLHHISGKVKWSVVNQAQLIQDLIHKHGQTEKEVEDALSITRTTLRRSLRTLSIINLYRASDYGDQFQANMYPVFEEIGKNVSLKDWLEWDESAMAPGNRSKQERLFSWLSKQEDVNDETGEIEVHEPIITKRDEIRDLSKFVSDDQALEKMEESRSISSGFTFSDAVAVQRFQNAMNNLKKEVSTAFQFSEFMEDKDVEQVRNMRDKLDRLIPTSKALLLTKDGRRSAKIFDQVAQHFSSLIVKQYRKLEALEVKSLARVNIFAGGNNTGKTTLLEACYLATQGNRMNSFLELQRYKSKFQNTLNANWLNENFNQKIEVTGDFNQAAVSLQIAKEQEEGDFDKLHYLSTIYIEAVVAGTMQASRLKLYDNREPELFTSEDRILCPATFTSPYRYNGDFLSRAYEQAVTDKYLDEVIGFIREKMDPDILSIDLVPNGRFLVNSQAFEQAVDITKYGEGLQRVFEIALLMGYSRNGVICIDELDSAIHKSLLIEFTKFIQESARRFNVQVFLSTHSKECIDAFVENDFYNDDITAYALKEVDGKIICQYLPGTELENLLEAINLDIR